MSEQHEAEKHVCSQCEGHRVKSMIYNNNISGLRLIPPGSSTFSRGIAVEAYVCENCGHIELFASNTDKYQKNKEF